MGKISSETPDQRESGVDFGGSVTWSRSADCNRKLGYMIMYVLLGANHH